MISASNKARLVGVRPPRGASCSMPARRDSAKRVRHVPTVPRVQSSTAAISLFSGPSAAARTIFARNTSRVGVLHPRDHLVNATRSLSVKLMALAIRMTVILHVQRMQTPAAANKFPYFKCTTLVLQLDLEDRRRRIDERHLGFDMAKIFLSLIDREVNRRSADCLRAWGPALR